MLEMIFIVIGTIGAIFGIAFISGLFISFVADKMINRHYDKYNNFDTIWFKISNIFSFFS